MPKVTLICALKDNCIKILKNIFSVENIDKHKRITILGLKINIKKYALLHKCVNKKISKYKYVHIMYNDKFNKPYVDFLNKYFNTKEHMVLCYRANEDKEPTLFPKGENVYEYKDIFGLNLNRKNIKKVIFHSLFMPDVVDFLYKNKELLKNKAYWAIWGGDLYNAPRDEMNDYVRSNFKGYINDIDTKYAKEKYNISNITFHKAFMPFPITKNMLNSCKKTEKEYIQIQINNSCDDSTLEILDVLSKFKNKNIKITTILSYGKKHFKDEIIKKGKENFGDKFEYIENYMSPEEYSQHLAQNDILILNQNRQQGIGNTNASIYLGCKVYIKESTTTNSYLNNEGIKIYNTEDITSMSFEQFIANEYHGNSKKNIERYFDNSYLKQCWQNVFES